MTMSETEKLVPVEQPQLVRPYWMTGNAENDWTEDATHENGQYFCECASCDKDFVGHKRRKICRKCHMEAKAIYDAMSPDERAGFEARLREEFSEFYRTNADVQPRQSSTSDNNQND